MTVLPVRIAVDVMGGDRPPAEVVVGAMHAAATRPGLAVTLVGADNVVGGLAAGNVGIEVAPDVVSMHEDPAHAARSKPRSSVRVAADLVRSRHADAMVSIGSTGAVLASAVVTLGRLPGVTRPALAVTVPATSGSVVLLDVGANVECTAEMLGQFALAGSAYAASRLGVLAPRVALLSIGAERGKGDSLRRETYELLESMPIRFVGNVEGGDVARGGVADVIVTDGFTGNVLLKGLEGMLDRARTLVATASDESPGRSVLGPLERDRHSGAVLLGVDGVVVVGHGDSGPEAVDACVALAAEVVRSGLTARVKTAMTERALTRPG